SLIHHSTTPTLHRPIPSPMSQPSLKIQALVWGGLILIVLAVVVAPLLAPPPAKPLPIYGAITGFSLSDQDGHMVSQADWRGEICVVDLIFTRCLGPCPIVSATMKQLQESPPAHPTVPLGSDSSDTAYDTPAVLTKYRQ